MTNSTVATIFIKNKLNMDEFLHSSIFNAIEAFIILYRQDVYNLKGFEFRSTEERNILESLPPEKQLSFYRYIQILLDAKQMRMEHFVSIDMVEYARITDTESLYKIFRKRQEVDNLIAQNPSELLFLIQKSNIYNDLSSAVQESGDKLKRIASKYNSFNKIKNLVARENVSFYVGHRLDESEKSGSIPSEVEFKNIFYTNAEDGVCVSFFPLNGRKNSFYCNATDILKPMLYNITETAPSVFSYYHEVHVEDCMNEIFKRSLEKIEGHELVTNIKNMPIDDGEKLKYIGNIDKIRGIKRNIEGKKEKIIKEIRKELASKKIEAGNIAQTLEIVQYIMECNLKIVSERNNQQLDQMIEKILSEFVYDTLVEINKQDEMENKND